MNYGFTISARKLGEETGGVFISGQALARGAFRLILPLKPRFKMAEGEETDYVPVWETEWEALAVVDKLAASASAPGESFAFKVCDIRASVEAGGGREAGGVLQANHLQRSGCQVNAVDQNPHPRPWRG